jgi:HK97 family phage portal protein
MDRIRGKSAPSSSPSSGPFLGFMDAYKSRRSPLPLELLQSHKNVAYACASINAQAFASVPLRLYHVTAPGQRGPKNFPAKMVDTRRLEWLKSNNNFTPIMANDVTIREVADHPLMKLLHNPNPFHGEFDLLEWTMTSMDIMGDAYWSFTFVDIGGSKVPTQIWPLQAHLMRPIPDYTDGNILSHYEYSGTTGKIVYQPDEVIHFKHVGLTDPYLYGLSPMRAAFEQVTVSDKLLAYEEAILDNRARPDMIISPKEAIGQQEARRLERKFQEQFRGGGSGGIVIAESGFDYKSMNFPPADLAALEIRKVSKEEIANAFKVPVSMLQSRDVNRANAEAGAYQHAKGAVLPRCRTFEQFLNMKLTPLYDERIFLAFDNPVMEDAAEARESRKVNVQTGIWTINETRRVDGLPPVDGGDDAYMPSNYAPIALLKENAQAIIDRNRDSATTPPGISELPKKKPKRKPKKPKSLRYRIAKTAKDIDGEKT